MKTDPFLVKMVLLGMAILLIGFILKLFKQPYIIGYIVAGVALGPSGAGVVTDEALISNFGSLGLILLLFFIGMEISISQLIANWKVSVFGTIIQVIFSIAAVWTIGYFLDWHLNRIIMLGFVISLSSTAVVIKLLQDRNEIKTRVGQNVISVLLAQDIIIVPMLIVLSNLAGEELEVMTLAKQIVGGLFILGLIAWVLKKKTIKVPFEKQINEDHELQVFLAFVVCFGFAILTGFFELSPALGAFVAGIIVSSDKATEWVRDSLHSFRVVFVALFFVSVGMLIDLTFLRANLSLILLFAFIVFSVNTMINATVMRIFKMDWRSSIYTGAILAQIGELSFILGSTGYLAGMITEYAYQLIVSIIFVTLVISPFWILITRKLVVRNNTIT